MNIIFNPRLFNPLYWHIKAALRDERIRFIYVEGGSSASKTFSIAQALTLDMMEHDYSTLIFRRFHVDIKDSIYSSFKAAAASLEVKPYWEFIQDVGRYNESTFLRFRGLEDEEDIKGVEGFNVVYNNEWNQFTLTQWGQQKKRLRGRPNQKFICDWNPVSSQLWLYKDVIDLDKWTDLPLDMPGMPTKYTALDPQYSFKRINAKGDSLWLKVTYRDNYWVVGHPSGKGGFYDQHTLNEFEHDRIHKPNLYRVYANGERGIMRTGGDFWKQFNETRHVKPVKLEDGTVHISIDNNVTPYVTVSCWQIDKVGKVIRQFDELPCKSPDNNAPKAAQRVIKWLDRIGYKGVVFVYGDPSTKARSTIDENNKSFFDKFMDGLKEANVLIADRVGRSAPEVATSAAFVNEIYEHGYDGWTIEIGDNCKESIDDYCSVKEDKDGTMLKLKVKDKETGQTYEPHGHFSDTKRYFITKVLEAEFNKYKARNSKLKIFAV